MGSFAVILCFQNAKRKFNFNNSIGHFQRKSWPEIHVSTDFFENCLLDRKRTTVNRLFLVVYKSIDFDFTVIYPIIFFG